MRSVRGDAPNSGAELPIELGSADRSQFERDWFVIPGETIYNKLRMKPLDVPGVRPLPRGASTRNPWPYDVHRTHLPILDLSISPTKSDSYPSLLRPYQQVSYDFIRSRRGTLLADEQRVGKTVPTLYSHDEDDHDPVFVVGPVASRVVWHEWAARRWGGCDLQLDAKMKRRKRSCAICDRVGVSATDTPSFMALEGLTLDVERVLDYKPRVLFCTYAVTKTWRLLFAHLKRIGTLVFDEIHLAGVQNRKNLTVESMRWLNTIAERVVAVTGTPLFNRTQGLWPILDIIAPAAFGDYWAFARRYCAARPTAHGWQANGESNMEELRKRLSEIMLRRTWAEIRGDLPPISRTLEIVQLPNSVKDKVETAAAQIRFETRAQKTFVGDLARLRKMYAKEKIVGSVEIIKGVLESGHSCVAWTWHKDTAAELHEKLVGKGFPVFGPITGETSVSARERILAAVESHNELPRVLIASIASLATAVNLSWASHEVFVELSWNPSDIAQAEMRPYNGTNNVAAIYVSADVEVDERLAHALIHKLESQSSLGLRAGVGDVADLLSNSLGIERDRSLDDLAARILETSDDWF